MKGTTKHVCVGKRVQIPAYTDLWMKGARYGTIERVSVSTRQFMTAGDARGADTFLIRLDHPQVKKPLWFVADDCRFVS